MSAPSDPRGAGPWPPRVVRDLLAALAGDARAPWGRSPAARADQPTRWQRAQRELRAVQRAEFALLLRRAARLRRTADAADLELCRQGLREVLLAARADHQPWPRGLERLARRMIGARRADWPSARRLARSAHALEPCARSRALLAELLAAQAPAGAAAELLARALLECPSRTRRLARLGELVRLLAPLRGDPRTRALVASLVRLRRAQAGRGAA